jgi:catechol 2,3-dioxygenase-like lactoylglutathione lyase family enzyme
LGDHLVDVRQWLQAEDLGAAALATVRYIVSDVAAASEFYIGQLGFELVQAYGPAMAIVRRGDLLLWLAGPGASASRPMPDGRQPVPGGWNRIVVETADLAALVASLKAAGAPFRNEIISGPGGRQTLCEDPSGNVVELFEPG